MSPALKEAVLELFRVVVLSIIPVAIMGLEDGSLDLRTIGVVAGVAALRFIDKLLHEMGKEKDNQKLIRGITRF